MTRFLAAALALACVCSSALAFSYDPPGTPAAVSLMAALPMAFAAAFGLWVMPRTFRWRLPLVALAIVLGGVNASLADAAAATVAQPATDTAVVTVPLGTWVASYASAAVEIVSAFVMAAVAFACRRLPAGVGAIVKGLVTQALVEKAIGFGMNTVAGATKGKALTFDVGNAVLANALNYAVAHVPGWLLSWTGGSAAIRDHIIALLPIEEGHSLATSTPTAAGPSNSVPVAKAA